MLLILTVIFGSVILAFLIESRTWGKNNKFGGAKALNGPRGLPVIGVGLEFVRSGSEETFKKIIDYTQKWDYRIRAYAAWHRFVLVAVPEDIEMIMTDQRFLEKSEDYNAMRDWLQDGLLTVSKKSKWQKRRKILTPAFHFSILEEFVQVMNQQASVLTNILKKHADGDGFDIAHYISLYTMDVICETSMGTKINAQTDVNSEYVKAVVELSSILHWRQHHFLARDNWFWKWTNNKKRHDYLVQKIHSHTDNIIEARRIEKQKNTLNGVPVADDLGIKKRTALLDILLDSTIDGAKLSNEDIREETDNFMFAGHDTTTSAINFLLYNLAKNPEIQQKVYEEIVEVLGSDPSKTFSVNDLSNFKYFELVLKESLRLYSPVPIIGRYLREDVEIRQRFAQLEIKAVTSRILQNFKLELADPNFEPILSAELVLKPVNGIWLKLKPRQNA
uniref:CSON004759 protein n=1 Tax=Culicoides sonorensis TaxID=179676 RepID=A0A336MPH9_CULSO